MRQNAQPVVLILAGPNGAGKSTASPTLVHDLTGIDRYINADAIARGLSPFEPDKSAVAAGRVMLEHIDELSLSKSSFALETTLSGIRLARRLTALQRHGYRVHLVYLWLPTPDLALQRVQQRVKLGGHSVDPDVVHRRYHRSLRNFATTYRQISDTWRVYDNSEPALQLIAHGVRTDAAKIVDDSKWSLIVRYTDKEMPDAG